MTIIANFPYMTTLTGSELIGGEQNGVTTRTTTGDIAALVNLNTADVQVFPNAGSFTWTKPAGNVQTVRVILISAGGGGGSGPWINALAAASGGGGGGGGGYMDLTFPGSALNSTETVVVGASGTPGLAPTGTGPGAAGTAGGNSLFGAYATCYGGGAGGAGSAGATSSGGFGGGPVAANTWAGGSNGTGTSSVGPGGSGGGGSSAAPAATAANGGFAAVGPSGGACGGGTSASTAYGGGVSWIPNGTATQNLIAGGAAGGNAGNSANGPVGYYSGSGAGGGGANASGAGGAGGSGLRGGGGGGGGVGVGAAGGTGGYGGAGYCAVITTFAEPTTITAAGISIPNGAQAGGLNTCQYSFAPQLSDVGFINDGGQHKLYSGIWEYGTIPNSSHFAMSNGFLTTYLIGTDGITTVNLATQMNNSLQGALPYASGAAKYYAEFTIRFTLYTTDAHGCVWMFDQAHNGTGGDYAPTPPAPYGVSNYSYWGEIDIAESSFGSYSQPLFTMWDHHGIAGSYVNNEYTNTNLGPLIDFTQVHTFGLLYDPFSLMMTQYIDGVQQAHHSMLGANIGDINSPGPRADLRPNYIGHNFYQVLSVFSRGANTPYGIELHNMALWTL